MLRPDPHSDEQPEDDAMELDGPSFEKLMQLVFSRPIYLESQDEPESESELSGEVEERSETENGMIPEAAKKMARIKTEVPVRLAGKTKCRSIICCIKVRSDPDGCLLRRRL